MLAENLISPHPRSRRSSRFPSPKIFVIQDLKPNRSSLQGASSKEKAHFSLILLPGRAKRWQSREREEECERQDPSGREQSAPECLRAIRNLEFFLFSNGYKSVACPIVFGPIFFQNKKAFLLSSRNPEVRLRHLTVFFSVVHVLAPCLFTLESKRPSHFS